MFKLKTAFFAIACLLSTANSFAVTNQDEQTDNAPKITCLDYHKNLYEGVIVRTERNGAALIKWNFVNFKRIEPRSARYSVAVRPDVPNARINGTPARIENL